MADEAQRTLDLITNFSIFEYENKVKPDYSDAGGIEEWDEQYQEWCDYDDLSGLDEFTRSAS